MPTITGTAGADTLVGTSGDDVIDGGDYWDTVAFTVGGPAVQVDLAIAGPQATGQGLDTLISIENLIGTSGGDSLRGDAGRNLLVGLAGDDLLEGRGGDDDLLGGEGADTLRGGDGADALSGGSGNDFLYGEAGDDRLILSTDTVMSAAGEDYLDGGAGADTLEVALSFLTNGPGVTINLGFSGRQQIASGLWATLRDIENVTGAFGADYLIGDNNNNVLIGGGGNDTLVGGGGADTLQGGFGDDYIDGGEGVDTVVVETFGPNSIITKTADGWTISDEYGSYGVDTVKNVEFIRFAFGLLVSLSEPSVYNGSAGDDQISGTGLNETLNGLGGSDTFYSSWGDDIYDGGDGADSVVFNTQSGVTVDLSVTSSQQTGHGSDTFVSIENLTGSSFGDTLRGDGRANWLVGSSGSDILEGRGGNDIIDGGPDADTLRGGDGDDTLRGGSGNDLVYGDAGADILSFVASANVGSDDDVVDGGAGSDTLIVSGAIGVNVSLAIGARQQIATGFWLTLSNIENLEGGGGADSLTGDANDNLITGNGGNDIVDGGAGIDTAVYSGAFDTYAFSHTNGTLTVSSSGTEGVDTLRNIEFLKFADQTVTLGDGGFIFTGTSGSDAGLYGTNANDILRGLAGNDVLRSSVGDDTYDGGDGVDWVLFTGAPAAQVDLAITGPQSTGQGLDTFISIEVVHGSKFNDTLKGNGDDNTLFGDDGDDVLEGRGGADTLAGAAGADILRGGDGDDFLNGGAGNDFLYGDAGDDQMGYYIDTPGIVLGDDFLDGGAGIDTFFVGWPSVGVTVDLTMASRQQIAPGLYVTLRNIENIKATSLADTLKGDGRDNAFWGYGGDDVIDGGDGTDTVVMSSIASNYTVTKTADGWTVADKRSSGDGVDTLKNVEYVKFTDQTMSLLSPPVVTPPVVTPPVVTPPTVTLTVATTPVAISNILRGSTETGQMSLVSATISNKLAAGMITPQQALDEVIKAAVSTTSVATMSYQFFTGKIPTSAGLDYLVSVTGPNGNNLNSAYYQSFNLENRYINFAVNLGKIGEGKDRFAADYGALTLAQATKKAYGAIFGTEPTDLKVGVLLGGGRDAYFEAYGKDGLAGIGTKAAMVGWLLAEAEKADVGTFAKANAAFLTDLADGAAYAVDIVGVYAKPEFAFTG